MKYAKGSFSALNEGNPLFEALERKPQWWKYIIDDPELYVEVRKDNYINVYYYGGCLAKIWLDKNDIMAETHQKYLGDMATARKDSKGHNLYEYRDCLENLSTKHGLDELKKSIAEIYIKHTTEQREIDRQCKVYISSEKKVQGMLKLHSDSNYIDTEFAYQTEGRNTMRIDLVELIGKDIAFIELKLITDSRLTNPDRATGNIEILDQMQKYHDFINCYAAELKDFYAKVLRIKKRIGVWSGDTDIENVSLIPKLLIVNTYSEDTAGRKKRLERIEETVSHQCFEYAIIKYQDLWK